MKAIVTVETEKLWYEMKYVEVKSYICEAEDRTWLMSKIYRNYYYSLNIVKGNYNKVKVEIIEE